MVFRRRHVRSRRIVPGEAPPPPDGVGPTPASDQPPRADDGPLAREHDDVVVRHGDLQIEEDMAAQRRLWRWQKWGRAGALALLAFALAGGLGGGLLAHREIERDGVVLAYERVGWREAPQAYELTVPTSAAVDGRLRVWLDGETARRMRPTDIVPPPVRAVAGPDRVVYEFETRPEAGHARIALRLEPQGVGRHAARLGIEGGPTFEVGQILLP